MKKAQQKHLYIYTSLAAVVVAVVVWYVWKGKKALGAIYSELPEKVYECNDGTYSDHDGRGACNWHGGLADKEPISFFERRGTAKPGNVADLKDVYAVWQEVAAIRTDPARFQNRDDDFSEESVQRIVANYDPNRLDPVTVWRDPKGQIWMLSGHSRLEAHHRLKKEKIPARFFRGTEQEAIDFARFYANRGATPEKLTEDIKIYRQLRDVEKLPAAELRARFEGQYNALENYSYLNPKGEFIKFLTLPKNQRDQFPLLEVKSGWVGFLRKQFPRLTNFHEQEMWDYLYRSQAGGKLRKEEFFQKVQDVVSRLDFSPDRPLRLESQGETGIFARADTEESAKRVREIDAAIRNYTNILKTDRSADKDGINRMITKLLREKEYLQKGVSEMMKTQTALFGLRTIK